MGARTIGYSKHSPNSGFTYLYTKGIFLIISSPYILTTTGIVYKSTPGFNNSLYGFSNWKNEFLMGFFNQYGLEGSIGAVHSIESFDIISDDKKPIDFPFKLHVISSFILEND